MPPWYDPLFALLAGQSAQTTRVTITLNEVAALAEVPIPDAAYAWSYWSSPARSPLRRRLRAAGWRVAAMHEGICATISFERLSPDAPAEP